MITRIELNNFMSHEHMAIDLAPGLNVLVGPNNCGKSAVVAALQILCHNENSTYVMRHGTRDCSVIIDTDDGHKIEWRRRGSPSYLIDGKEFGRLQQSGLPPQLHQVLRLPKVEVGNDSDFNVHFGTQKEPIFLLANSAGNRAKFFASSSDAMRLVEMQKRHKEKLSSARNEKSRLEAEAKIVSAELEALHPAVELQHALNVLEQQREQLVRLANTIEGLHNRWTALTKQQLHAQQLRTIAATLEQVPTPPLLSPAEPLQALIERLTQTHRAHARARSTAAAIAEIPAPPPLFPTEALQQIQQHLSRWNGEFACNRALQVAARDLASPPLQHDTELLRITVGRLTVAADRQRESIERSRALAPLPSVPELQNVQMVAQHVHKLTAACNTTEKCAAQAQILSPLQPLAAGIITQPLADIAARIAQSQVAVDNCRSTLAANDQAAADAEQLLRQSASSSTCAACGATLDANRMVALAAIAGGHCP